MEERRELNEKGKKRSIEYTEKHKTMGKMIKK